MIRPLSLAVIWVVALFTGVGWANTSVAQQGTSIRSHSERGASEGSEASGSFSQSNSQIALPTRPASAGHVARSTVGEVGHRVNREDSFLQSQPLARIDSRIRNRVQSRLRTRIDRIYDPQETSTSAFNTAANQARIVAGKIPR